MIKAIANKKVDITKEEYEYYLTLEKSFGADAFIGLFNTDDDGMVIGITPSPSKPTAMLLIFFILNIMQNQRLRKMETWAGKLNDLESRLANIEKKMK